MTSGFAIAATALSKRFGSVQAVDDLTLAVPRGEIYGFLGPNGAGKTTTIRMLLGLVRPSGGVLEVLGHDAARAPRPWLRQVGSLVETATAYRTLTTRENLQIQQRLTGAPLGAVGRAIERLGLGPVADRVAGHLSLGNLQRLALARALLHRPQLLVLDEPANGLDPAGIVEVRELLHELARNEGVTVFMSSHNLAEVAHLADRIGIILDGRLVEQATKDELATRARQYVREAFTEEQRREALLTSDLERYFLARTSSDARRPTSARESGDA